MTIMGGLDWTGYEKYNVEISDILIIWKHPILDKATAFQEIFCSTANFTGFIAPNGWMIALEDVKWGFPAFA
jgi:hypothetical protein